jgi:hypothetical protein
MRELTDPRREEGRGQLRLSLTNIYHEWPVMPTIQTKLVNRRPASDTSVVILIDALTSDLRASFGSGICMTPELQGATQEG